MRLHGIGALAAMLLLSNCGDGVRREWTLMPGPSPSLVRFILTETNHGDSSAGPRVSHDERHIPIPSALGADGLAGQSRTVAFSVVRDAGTFVCKGTAGAGRGSGTVEFAPDTRFAAALIALDYGPVSPWLLYQLAWNDITLRYAQDLHEAGLQAEARDLTELRNREVTRHYVEQVSSAGMSGLTAGEILALKAAGTDPAYISGLKRAGYLLNAEAIAALTNYAVPLAMAVALRKSGYDFNASQLIELHRHGLDAAFVARISRPGKPLSFLELAALTQHRERAMKAAR